MNKLPTEQQTYAEVVSINVDVQKDFLHGGSLAINHGDVVIDPLNLVNEWTRQNLSSVIFTRDWHPARSTHFDVNGGLWPKHCVKDTPGADFHDDLVVKPSDFIASKGVGLFDEGYSGYKATLEDSDSLKSVFPLSAKESTVGSLIDQLTERAWQKKLKTLVLIGGLATDYCVRATVLDTLANTDRQKVDVVVVGDAIKAVNLQPDDEKIAIRAMKEAGARFVVSEVLTNGDLKIASRNQ